MAVHEQVVIFIGEIMPAMLQWLNQHFSKGNHRGQSQNRLISNFLKDGGDECIVLGMGFNDVNDRSGVKAECFYPLQGFGSFHR